MEEFFVDIDALGRQIKDEAMLTVIKAFCPDEKTKQLVTSYMEVFGKHGIPVETAFQITMDLVNVMKQQQEEK